MRVGTQFATAALTGGRCRTAPKGQNREAQGGALGKGHPPGHSPEGAGLRVVQIGLIEGEASRDGWRLGVRSRV